VKTKVPLAAGAQRLIIATCEKGTVENIEDMRGIKAGLDKVKSETRTWSKSQRRPCSARRTRRSWLIRRRGSPSLRMHNGLTPNERPDQCFKLR